MSPPRPRTRSTARSAQDRGAPQDGGPAQEGRAGKAPSRPGTSSDELRELLEPFVTDAGFELDALDVRSAGRRHTVRMVVDSDSGAGLDAIARLSRAASDALDSNEHLVGGSYTLEVTSPGVDRPLTLPRHWRRAHLRLVTVRPQPGSPLGDAVFAGRVGAAGDTSVTLLVDGRLREVRYADVAHAAVEVEFAPPPTKEIALLDPGAIEEDAMHDGSDRPDAADDSVEDSQ
ncbi:ribosome maturation factor RimP [Pseudonocardia charpentierae]|uniref:Ribosome maturation factor RimP n=1 Tax=Pseudonocardia charpentierae TaxID=3075545 RepID=A0ABU2NBB7_9PSEU|nr:ribosome maturation factor RimP [Pseudonocardia sp. DSM 45834]MDT0351010.1 ribosome maturation factor RimP [Pseudonocardia sp. DSM 45834]